MSYDLDNEGESFEFTLGGNKYKMRYPTTEELTGVDKLEESKVIDWMYGFITPLTEGAPEIKEALAKKNIKVMQRFTEMIQTEFSMGDINAKNPGS